MGACAVWAGFLTRIKNSRAGSSPKPLEAPVISAVGRRALGSTPLPRLHAIDPTAPLIDRSGHYVHMDNPQELVQVVTKFLDEPA